MWCSTRTWPTLSDLRRGQDMGLCRCDCLCSCWFYITPNLFFFKIAITSNAYDLIGHNLFAYRTFQPVIFCLFVFSHCGAVAGPQHTHTHTPLKNRAWATAPRFTTDAHFFASVKHLSSSVLGVCLCVCRQGAIIPGGCPPSSSMSPPLVTHYSGGIGLRVVPRALGQKG